MANERQPEITFYISKDGDDRWSGRLSEPNQTKTDGPFASLKRAKDAIHNLECRLVAGELRQNINVFIRGGIYFLDEPLIFTLEESANEKCFITFSAYKDEKVIISGGRKITQWEKINDSLWKAELADVKSGKWFFRSLRVADKQAIRARYPNYDPKDPTKCGWCFVSKTIPEKTYDRIIFKPSEFPNWDNWDDADVHIFPAWGWVNTIMKVKGVDKENHAIIVDCKQDIRPGNRFFIANVRQALDSPGEWCLDSKSGELIYWATDENFPNVDVIAPAMDRLIVIKGDTDKGKFVENINFINLTFSDTDFNLDGYYDPADSAIWLSGAKNCTIEGCLFENVNGYAVRLDNKSNGNKIIGNRMIKLGQGGVIMLGNTENQPFNNIVAGNDIQDCGQVYKHVAGVYITTGSGNLVAHNNIYRMPRYGISFKSYDKNASSHNNIAEYNEIIDSNLETNDTGAIETLGRDYELSGNIIRFNYIRNVVGMNTTYDGQIVSPYFTWGIYLDDYSSGTTVYGNIVNGTVVGAICIHGGKNNIVENNIFMNGSERQMTLQPRDDFMTGNVFRHNIVLFNSTKSVLWYSWQNTWRPDRLSECDYNIYWHTGGLNLLDESLKITPEGSFSAWQNSGFDKNSLVVDPMIVSEENPMLKDDSPAVKIEFKPIDLDKIGLKGFNKRKYIDYKGKD
ncbi:MAG: right-handed parallel beta-helix repeat-containing protein [Candidatus Poribacteria bacterium]